MYTCRCHIHEPGLTFMDPVFNCAETVEHSLFSVVNSFDREVATEYSFVTQGFIYEEVSGGQKYG